MNAKFNRDLKSYRGQGLLEYLLVLSIVIAVAVGVLIAVSQSTSLAVNKMVTSIESVTGVQSPAN